MWRLGKTRDSERRATEGRAESRTLRQNVLIWIEGVLLVSGLTLAAIYGAARIESYVASRDALKNFEAMETSSDSRGRNLDEPAPSADVSSVPEAMELPEVDFSLWGDGRVKGYKQSVRKPPSTPLAVLRIPKIRLEVPLFEGTDDLALNHGVGRIAGTARPGEQGNIGIAGHRDGFFRGLKDVVVGDAIELKTLRGTDTYIVDQIRIVKPNAIEVLQPQPASSLTLVTCYPFYFLGRAPQRYIVTASLSGEINGKAENLKLSSSSTASNSIRRKNMNNVSRKANVLTKGVSVIVLAMMALGTSLAQDSTVTTVQHGPSSFDTQVKNAEVVYVEGNDLVLKLENGGVEHLVVPDSDRFTIDGNEVSVHELVPGTKLTQIITTTTTPRYISSIRTIEGKVWHVNSPRSVILTLPDNTNQAFNVPNHAKFTINGERKTVFDLKKGMKIKATIATDDQHTVIEQSKFAFGQAPPVLTPREVGVLLFLTPSRPQVTLASAEQPAETLPETGSLLPLMGLLGTLAITLSLGLRAVRRTRAI